jgi:hypothetical protein
MTSVRFHTQRSYGRNDKGATPRSSLLGWGSLIRLTRLSHNERFHPFKLLFEAGHEIVAAVLEENDEAEGEEKKQDNPKQGA